MLGHGTSFQQHSQVFSSALEICGSALTHHPHQHGMRLNLSHQTAVLCYLMSKSIPWNLNDPFKKSWFCQSDLLGRYALGIGQYVVALQCIAYYLLQLPKSTLLGIFGGSDAKKTILETPAMHLICRVLRIFLRRSPPTLDLHFLVVLTAPIMESIDTRISARHDYFSNVSIF